MNLSFNKRHFIISFIFLSLGWLTLNYIFFVRRGMLSFHSDFISIADWSWDGKRDYLKTFGIYMPVIPYIFSMYSQLFSSYTDYINGAVFLKAFFILIDALSFSLLIALIPNLNPRRFWLTLFLTLINLSLIYNTIFWGQVDTLHSALIFCSFVALVKNRYKLVWLLFTVAIFTKIVSVIFLPIIGIYIVNELACNRLSIKQIVKDFTVVPLAVVMVLLPIIISGALPEYIEIIKRVFSDYDTVSANAFNIYHLISNNTNLIDMSSSTMLFRSFTYAQFGLLTFSVSMFVCLLPIIKIVYGNIFLNQRKEISLELVLLVFILIPLLFFFFTTKVRERFAHPYLLFLTLYCFYHKRYVFWFLGTLVYALQLEAVLKYTKVWGSIFISLFDETNLYQPTLIAVLFLVLIVYLFREMAKATLQKSL
jgi:Gpi18-like mannosyltransferase